MTEIHASFQSWRSAQQSIIRCFPSTDLVVANVQHLDLSQLKHRSLHKGTHDVYDTTQYQIE